MDASSTITRVSFSCTVVMLLGINGCRSTSAAHSAPNLTTTATVGASLDDIDARNRADIATQLGRPVVPGPASPEEVVAMTRAGVDPRFIVCYVNRSTAMNPVTAQDVIYMHDQGVNEQVIQAMLTPGSALSRSDVARSMPPRVIVIGDPWWPYYYPRCGCYYGCGYGYRCY